MDQRNAAQEGGRGKAGRVADDAAADGDEDAAAVGAASNQRVVNLRDRLQVLVAFAVGNQDRLTGADDPLYLLAVEAPDDRARYEEPPRTDTLRIEDRRQPLDDPLTDQDRGCSIAGADVNADGVIGEGCVRGIDRIAPCPSAATSW